jgi:hypothetical protein
LDLLESYPQTAKKKKKKKKKKGAQTKAGLTVLEIGPFGASFIYLSSSFMRQYATH